MEYRHHIIPKHEWKSRFGNLVGFNAPDNLVTLTLEQHIQAHQLLHELNKNEYDRIAYQGMLGMIGAEEIHITLKSLGGKTGGARSKGKKRPHQSPEHRKKISEARINAWKNPTESMVLGIKKMSGTRRGRKLGEGHKRKISLSLLGNQYLLGKRWNQDKIVCIHCKKVGGAGPMKRYHFNNCKENHENISA